MEISKSIREALNAMLNEEITVASWGITNIIVNTNSISFMVDGFKYCGSVKIEECNDGYLITISNKSFVSTKKNFVALLDYEIEKTDNYEEYIANILNLD